MHPGTHVGSHPRAFALAPLPAGTLPSPQTLLSRLLQRVLACPLGRSISLDQKPKHRGLDNTAVGPWPCSVCCVLLWVVLTVQVLDADGLCGLPGHSEGQSQTLFPWRHSTRMSRTCSLAAATLSSASTTDGKTKGGEDREPQWKRPVIPDPCFSHEAPPHSPPSSPLYARACEHTHAHSPVAGVFTVCLPSSESQLRAV